MTIIYLSPHYDDAVLSCGGLIWTQVHNGEDVEIWTVCGAPGELTHRAQVTHKLMGMDGRSPVEMIMARQAEDEAAMNVLGIKKFLWLHNHDDIYKTNSESILLPTINSGDQVIVPMGIRHPDHKNVRRAAELAGVQRISYYIEVPYCWRYRDEVNIALISTVWGIFRPPMPPEALERWQMAAACYTSQIPMLFGDTRTLRAEISGYFLRRSFALYSKPV